MDVSVEPIINRAKILLLRSRSLCLWHVASRLEPDKKDMPVKSESLCFKCTTAPPPRRDMTPSGFPVRLDSQAQSAPLPMSERECLSHMDNAEPKHSRLAHNEDRPTTNQYWYSKTAPTSMIGMTGLPL